jgi:CheY-like chemotaxis protein
VDDDPIVLAVGERVLSGFGFTVLTAENGAAGVELFAKHSGELRGVLLDMTMPVMNGEEAFRRMREINPAVKVLLTSGFNEIDATSRFVGRGLAGFIQKPFSVAGMQAVLRELLG